MQRAGRLAEFSRLDQSPGGFLGGGRSKNRRRIREYRYGTGADYIGLATCRADLSAIVSGIRDDGGRPSEGGSEAALDKKRRAQPGVS